MARRYVWFGNLLAEQRRVVRYEKMSEKVPRLLGSACHVV